MLKQGSLTPKSRWKIALVTARFNHEITEKLESGAYEELLKIGLTPEQVLRVRVPGAVEIPLTAQSLLDADYDAVIALGAVIQGETKHFDYVCQSVERGCMQVMLESKKPVVFGVLTTDNEEQALDRTGGRHGHKGRDAAQTAVEMLDLMDQI
jgi:6,7-dimethyl-8-ribityllumazine synthase